jgi:hypothetical protein
VKFYTFGIQRTCTNYAKQLVLTNFYSEWGNINDAGNWSWKHNPDADKATSNLTNNSSLIFCYKTPLMWVESIIRGDVDFINYWNLTKFSDDIDPDLIIDNIKYRFSLRLCIEKWIEFHTNWIKYLNRTNYIIMNQRKMCDQPGAVEVLSQIENKLGLKKRNAQWILFTNNVDYRVSQTAKDFDERKKDYITNTTRKLTEKQINYIKSKIPEEIIKFYET